MKQISLIIFLAALAGFCQAQQFDIEGQVFDATENIPLPGAHIELKSTTDAPAKLQVTDGEGTFRFNNIAQGEYRLIVEYLGFATYEKQIIFNGSPLVLPTIRLKNAALDLDEVEVTEKVVPVQQLGDTTQMEARAYKTMPDASAEDLLKKMPTVEIQNGKVKAQGEDVKEVLVDGRPFFGNDPTAALKNLPAEVIERIQIFDQQSEQAQFSGFDDGQTSKTINIITKSNMRSSQFGKLYAGYGYEDVYDAGGNLNIFNNDQRISVIGLSNNINKQNFAAEDLLGVLGDSGGRSGGRGGRGGRGGGRGRNSGGASVNDFLVNQSGGISTTHAFGLNYSDQLSEKLELNGSYFFNFTDNDATSQLQRQYIDDEVTDESYLENMVSNSQNTNHRISLKLDYKLDEANSFVLRPQASWQSNDGKSNTFAQFLQGMDPLSQTSNVFSSDLKALNFSNNLLYRHKFDKDKRTLSINTSINTAPKEGVSNLLSTASYFADPTEMDSLNQQSELNTSNFGWSANTSYTEPVGKQGLLMMNYQISKQQEESDKKTFDFSDTNEDYDILNEQLSNVFTNDYWTHQGGMGYNFRNKDFMFLARLNVEYATLMNEQTFPKDAGIDRSYTAFLPFAMARFNFAKNENLRLTYRSSTDLPNVNQLQNVLDNSNPLLLSIGNPNLEQSVEHNLYARYSKTNPEKSTVFYAYLGGKLTQNYIANQTFLESNGDPVFDEINLQQGAQLSRPVNQNGYYNFRAFMTYGMPIAALKSNLNINLNGNFSRIPGLIDEQLNFANTTTTGIGLVLGSNISEKLDFTISSRTNYNVVKNSIFNQSNSNYLDQQSSINFNWLLGNDIIFRTEAVHQYYNGLADDFTDNFLLWNMSIGKKLFKNNRGELSIMVNDLLNQNNALNRKITDVYYEDVQTNILQRFVMLRFTYNLRHLTVAAEKPAEFDR